MGQSVDDFLFPFPQAKQLKSLFTGAKQMNGVASILVFRLSGIVWQLFVVIVFLRKQHPPTKCYHINPFSNSLDPLARMTFTLELAFFSALWRLRQTNPQAARGCDKDKKMMLMINSRTVGTISR